MKLKSIATGLAALSLMVTPTLAQAAPTKAPQPATEQVSGDNAVSGSGAVVGVLALIAIILGVLAATSGSSKPTSP